MSKARHRGSFLPRDRVMIVPSPRCLTQQFTQSPHTWLARLANSDITPLLVFFKLRLSQSYTKNKISASIRSSVRLEQKLKMFHFQSCLSRACNQSTPQKTSFILYCLIFSLTLKSCHCFYEFEFEVSLLLNKECRISKKVLAKEIIRHNWIFKWNKSNAQSFSTENEKRDGWWSNQLKACKI